MTCIIKKIGIAIAAAAALVATSAFAETKKPAPPPVPRVPAFTWTGFYGGFNAGGICTNDVANRGPFMTTFGPLDPNGFIDFGHRIPLFGEYPTFSAAGCGFIGGGQAGYNVQSANWVWGLEGDLQGTTFRAHDNRFYPAQNVPSLGAFAFFAQDFEQASQQLQWLATLRARAGFLASPAADLWNGRTGCRLCERQRCYHGNSHSFRWRNGRCDQRPSPVGFCWWRRRRMGIRRIHERQDRISLLPPER